MATTAAPVRAIGRWDLTAAIVNGVIGSAVFAMPAVQARLTGAWSPLACVLGGVGILAIVLCFAEAASRYDEAGGPYLYFRDAFGAFPGFQAGWLTLWVRLTAVAANLNVFADSFATLVPGAAGGLPRALLLLALMGGLAAVNVRGVRQGTWTVDVFTAAKLLPLVALVILGLPWISSRVLATQAVAAPDWTEAVLLLMFAYGGFESPLIPAGEARDPRRDSAPSLLTALLVIALLYTLVQLAVVGLVPHAASAKAPVAAAFGVLFGPGAAALAVLATLVSIFGYTAGNTLQAPRLIQAMAARRELPAALGRLHSRFRTPVAATWLYAGAALGLAVAGSFAGNATMSAVVRLLTYGGTCAAVLVLRRRGLAAFTVPALVPLVGLGFCAFLLVRRSGEQFGLLAALVALGTLLFALASRRPAPLALAGAEGSEHITGEATGDPP